MKYLLDTCIIEAILKAELGHENVRNHIATAPQGSLAISALTDPLIAAQAIAMGAVCVTDNVRHFLRVPGLIVENWLEPE